MTIKNKLYIISILPTVAILIFSITYLIDKYRTYHIHERLISSSELLQDTASTIYELQKERGLSSLYIHDNSKDKQYFKDSLVQQRASSDKSINILTEFLNSIDKYRFVVANEELINNVRSLLSSIIHFRQSIDKNEMSVNDTINYFTHVNLQLLELSDSIRIYSSDSNIQSNFKIINKLTLYQELCVQERVLVALLNNEKILLKDKEKLNGIWRVQYDLYQNIKSLIHFSNIKIDPKHPYQDNDDNYIKEIREKIINTKDSIFTIDSRTWFNVISHRIDNNHILQEKIFSQIISDISSKNSKLYYSFIYQVIFTILAISVLISGVYLIATDINRSIQNLSKGINEFFEFLNFKSTKANEIIVTSNDEISHMKREINKQIQYLQTNIKNDKYFINELTEIVRLMKNGDFSKKIYFEPTNPSLIELKTVFDELVQLINDKISQQTQSLEELNKTLESKVYEQTIKLENQIKSITIARDEAIAAERAKDDFLANMSHEIRTPLNAILGFVTILNKRIQNEKSKKYLNIIDKSGKSLLTIINDILDFSKIQSGKFNISRCEVNPMEEFSATTLLFASKAYEKHIAYVVYIDPKLPKKISIDDTRVKQILSNLLSNAMKFTPNDGTIKVKISIKDETLSISVQDNGIGIAKENISKVFSAFEQADGSTTRKYGGTGLGLSISAKLAQLMNGKLSLKSTEGIGSIFTLEIPIEVIDNSTKKLLDINLIKKYRFALLGGSEENEIFTRVIRKYLSDFEITDIIELTQYKDTGYDILFFVPCENYNEEIIEAGIPAIAMLRSNYVKLGSIPHITSLYAPFAPTSLIQAIDDITVENIQEISTEDENHIETNDEVKFIGHVLIAEDNKTNQMLIGIMMDDYGLEYKIANNGIEAVKMFREYSFDLVLMDENMPELNGLGAMQQIKEYEKTNSLNHTPIIALTANALKSDVERFLSAGMDGFVAKPINTELLESELKKYLRTT